MFTGEKTRRIILTPTGCVIQESGTVAGEISFDMDYMFDITLTGVTNIEELRRKINLPV
jgi:hypothetical protein